MVTVLREQTNKMGLGYFRQNKFLLSNSKQEYQRYIVLEKEIHGVNN
jgi:hypothetical protein